MSRLVFIVGLGLALGWSGACNKPETGIDPYKDYARPLPPGELALRKLTDPSAYPDFSRDFYNRGDLIDAATLSLEYLSKPSSQRYFPYGDVSHARAVASLERFQDLLISVPSMAEIDRTLRAEFDVYQSVGYDGAGTVYFTGYYCPIFDGRRTPDAEFRYPLYGLPADLEKDEYGKTLGQRTASGGFTPYPTRREIEQTQLLAGTEIAWLKDPFEAYVVTVQGSGKLRLADGTLLELGYAGNNGHDYTAVGKLMIDDGLIDRNELSLQAMITYFRNHPQDVQRYCWQNDRYVFFQEIPGGPYGSIGVAVTPYRTLATDKEVYPRACLAFVDTRLPQLKAGELRVANYAAFMLDQDTGGAIRAAGRGDIFMGTGAAAEGLAGRTGAEGSLYYLFIKDEFVPPTE